MTACGRPAAHPPSPPPPPPPVDKPPTSPLEVADMPLPEGTVGVAYDVTISARGAHAGSARWQIGGTLPPGLAVDGQIGPSLHLAGRPSLKGSFAFTLRVDDGAGETSERDFTIVVTDGLAIDGALPAGDEGQPYAATLSARGGVGTKLAWSLSNGALPTGVTLSATGATAMLQGTPPPGRFSFTVSVTSDRGERATRDCVLAVRSSLVITDGGVPTMVSGSPFKMTFKVAGGVPGYSWSLSGGSLGALSATSGDSVDLAGTPIYAGTYLVTIEVSDSNGGSRKRDYMLTVLEPLTIANPWTPDGQLAVAYSAALTAHGGSSASYAWAVTAGTLPPGLTLDPTGSPSTSLHGTPSQRGTYAFDVTVSTGAAGESATAHLKMLIGDNPPRLVTQSLPHAVWKTPYKAQIETQSIVGGALSWSLTAGELPPGLALDVSSSTSPTIGGTPLVCGTYRFTIAVSDSGGTGYGVYDLVVDRQAIFEVLADAPPAAHQGHPYSLALESRDGQGTLAWTLDAGGLPPGLALDAAGGVIAGTPTAAGWYPFTVRATDAAGQVAKARLAIRVAPARQWAAAILPSGLALREISATGPGAQATIGLFATPSLPSFAPQADWATLQPPGGSGTGIPTSMYLVDLRAQPQALSLGQGDADFPPLWSPDGGRFAYGQQPVDGTLDLWVAELSGGSPSTAKIARAPWPYRWSPDGTKLAYWSPDWTALNIFDGKSTRTIPLPSVSVRKWFAEPLWAPSSSGIAFAVTTKSGTEQLVYLDLDDPASVPVPLTPSDRSLAPEAQSADFGGLVLTGNFDVNTRVSYLYFVDLRSRQPSTAVLVGRLSEQGSVSWSPDSRRLLLGGDTPHWIERDAIGMAPQSIDIGNLDRPTAAIVWTPDSAHLGYVNGQGMFELALAGSGPVAFGPGASNGYFRAASLLPERHAWIYQATAGLFLADLGAGRKCRAARFHVPGWDGHERQHQPASSVLVVGTDKCRLYGEAERSAIDFRAGLQRPERALAVRHLPIAVGGETRPSLVCGARGANERIMSSTLRRIRNIPFFPLFPFGPLLLAGSVLALEVFTLIRMRRLAQSVEALLRSEATQRPLAS
jgi:hypothetical protein